MFGLKGGRKKKGITDAFSWPLAESTQTVQALQHPSGEGPLSANKEVEIRSLKSEIDILKKQIAGQETFWSCLVEL